MDLFVRAFIFSELKWIFHMINYAKEIESNIKENSERVKTERTNVIAEGKEERIVSK